MTIARYEAIRQSDDPKLDLVTGTAEDRLAGLDVLLDKAQGASVLDITCNTGGVSEAFAKAGAGSIDGVDFWRPGVDLSRRALEPYPIRTRFAVCDLTGGFEAVRSALSPMPARYDIVLYLGAHHHLSRQMPPAELNRLVGALCEVAADYVVVRTPDKYMPSAQEVILARGFEVWRDAKAFEPSREYSVKRTVGGLKIFRRRA